MRTGAAQQYNPGSVVLGRLGDSVRECCDRLAVDRVEDLRPVQDDLEHPLVPLDDDIRHRVAPPAFRSMIRRALAGTLPCATRFCAAGWCSTLPRAARSPPT